MKDKKIRLTLVAVLILSALAGGLRGQTYRSFQEEYEQVLKYDRLRFGPLRFVPLFRLSSIGYDSNVYYRDTNENPVADYTATLSPEVKAYWLVGSSVILSVTENPEFNFYLKESRLRSFTNSLSPALRLLLFRRLALSGDYHLERHVRRAFSELEAPIRDTRKGFRGGLFYETPRGTAVGLSGSLDEFRYESLDLPAPAFDYAKTLDRTERSVFLELYYRVFTQSYVFLRGGYGEYDFRSPDLASLRDAYSYQAYGGFRFPLLGRARGTISLGYKKFIPRAEGRKEFSGLVGQTDVTFRIGRVGLNLAYTRDNYFSYLDTAYYYVEDFVKGGLSFYLFPFLRLEGSLQYGRLDYPEPLEIWHDGTPYLIDSRLDTTRLASVGLAFRIVGSTGLGVSYNLFRRRSNAPGFHVERDFVGAYIAYDF